MQDPFRVRIESNHQRFLTRLFRFGSKLPANELVAQMHAVKIADGDKRPLEIGSYIFAFVKYLHKFFLTHGLIGQVP